MAARAWQKARLIQETTEYVMDTAVQADRPTVADALVRALRRHGITCFFGQSLPSALVLAAEAAGVRQISYRQENAGGAMADGFARAARRIGMVAAQNGPAATLLVPPLAEAMKASVPLIAFVQEVETPHTGRNAFQELDHFGLFGSVAKMIRRLDDPARIGDYVDTALICATSGRPGPVVLLLPADILRGPAAAERLFPRTHRLGEYPLDRPRPCDARITEAAAWLSAAEMPVAIAGGGVLLSDASAALMGLMETASLPVMTTNMGKGAIDETHPLACGVQSMLNGPGSIGQETRSILLDADLVLLVGTRTNQNGTDSWTLFRDGTRFIHVDMDPGEIGRNFEALRLMGDARETLEALGAALAREDLTRRNAERPALEARIAQAWTRFEAARAIHSRSDMSPVRPERVMADLQQILTSDTLVVADASYSSMWVVGQLRCAHAGARFITPRGLAGLGWGMPMALGAAIAQPDQRVVAVVGDGGFAHGWAELETMKRHQIPVVVIVLNNGVLGFQRDAELVKFGRFTSACHFAEVDHAAIARACGVDAVQVERAGDVLPTLNRALESRKPWLIDVITDPGAHPPLSLFTGKLREEP